MVLVVQLVPVLHVLPVLPVPPMPPVLPTILQAMVVPSHVQAQAQAHVRVRVRVRVQVLRLAQLVRRQAAFQFPQFHPATIVTAFGLSLPLQLPALPPSLRVGSKDRLWTGVALRHL